MNSGMRSKPTAEDDASFNSDMLRVAREARAMSQAALAQMAGISQGKVSKLETGMLQPNASDLAALATVLGFPSSFFTWTDRVYGFESHEVFHRRRAAVAVRQLDTIHAHLNLKRMQLKRLLRSASVGEPNFPQLDPDEFDDDVEKIAQLVRAHWRLPRGPVLSMVDAIEEAGGIVLPYDFGSPKVDAMSQWVPGSPPTFYVNTNFPADRTRWSLAHEVGHMVMHRLVGPDIEDQAHRFAAEFLLPADEIRPQLIGASINSLAMLKPIWKVSIAALIRRARSLGLIGADQERRLWIRMSQLGYRKVEPMPLPPEEPRLFRELAHAHVHDLEYSTEELAEMLADLDGYWTRSRDDATLTGTLRVVR